MTTLEFHGPFHFDDIDAETGDIKTDKKAPNTKKPGIYIWGFMYEYDKQEKRLKEPIDFKDKEKLFEPHKMQFLPYYVGLRKNVFARLKEHHNVYKGHVTKYTRLSLKYMESFYNDLAFPINIKRKRNNKAMLHLCLNQNSKIEYFNDDQCLQAIYPGISPVGKTGNFPLVNQNYKGNKLPDTLDYLINTKDNFWFCYSIVPDDLKCLLEYFETYTFWSLKGKTISQTECCPLINPNINISDKTQTNIFKEIRPCKDFPGYL